MKSVAHALEGQDMGNFTIADTHDFCPEKSRLQMLKHKISTQNFQVEEKKRQFGKIVILGNKQ